MKHLIKRILACSLVATAVSTPAMAADNYPSRPIKIIVPYAPGGATDVISRLLAQRMSTASGYNFIVENKPGAGGGIGAGYVARSKPDGYTLLMGTSNTHGLNPFIYHDLAYDPQKSFAPVAAVVDNVVVLLANQSFPASSLKEAVEVIKTHPGKYSYASPGVGTVHEFAMALLSKKLGLKIQHVPYKGAGPAMMDLAADTVPLMMGGLAPALPFIKSGKVKLLGIANDEKYDSIKGVEYFSDLTTGASVSSWLGLFAPAGTSAQTVEKLNTLVNTVLASPEFIKELDKQGTKPLPMTPEAFRKLVADGLAFWKKTVEETGTTQ
ncbi:tripartite tricarboxylate transporter substrate binding protein [Paralcaligenes sp. KSB-10]|uniref:Bug family tripartite tricarboxylate transporter substrate binding protein n=1 Tax=Paralcaligenes sp. KSB-10 TaxID=2901142 RepID=UPI001E2A7CF3|nr:tripartite tricarboxylate transporter substrate-binding protein [Paralcaligenes sp. KSB-10]UHL63101.1 tripartite tricarboxylate transporter substrate binding protein [Paralcaligenes sp. KSB-10]